MENSTDIYSEQKRSEVMSKVRSKDTKPELQVRSWLHKRGFRYRLHRKDLPGCPDIVLPKYETVIFVHGCFWHQHPACKKATIPKKNHKFWKQKLKRNVERDSEHVDQLEEKGWKVITVWECAVKKDVEQIMETIESRVLETPN
jgi:DNA mismatch endonuclease (patch repair protein)